MWIYTNEYECGCIPIHNVFTHINPVKCTFVFLSHDGDIHMFQLWCIHLNVFVIIGYLSVTTFVLKYLFKVHYTDNLCSFNTNEAYCNSQIVSIYIFLNQQKKVQNLCFYIISHMMLNCTLFWINWNYIKINKWLVNI